MAVTNAMTIMLKEAELQMEGIITADECIHTYQHWKAIGFQVKRGEKAIAKFPIWKYGTKTIETDDGKQQVKGRCFSKMSEFFSTRQVEPIKEKTA